MKKINDTAAQGILSSSKNITYAKFFCNYTLGALGLAANTIYLAEKTQVYFQGS